MLILLLFVSSISAQQAKRPLTFDDIMKWNRITETIISNDGNLIVYKIEPWKGDPIISLVGRTGKEIKRFDFGKEPKITNNSKYLIYNIITPEEEIRQLKLKKTKKDDMPLNKLAIVSLTNLNSDTINELKSYKIPQKWDGWVAYQTKTKIEKDTTDKESLKKEKKESAENGFRLTIHNIENATKNDFSFVSDYVFAAENEVITFVSTGDDADFKPGVYYYDLKTENLSVLIEAKGTYKQLTIDKKATQIAFMADTTDNKKDDFSLFSWKGSGLATEIISSNNSDIPQGMKLSENGKISFGEKSNRIYFGLAPEQIEKDTTKTVDELPQLDIWNWNEPTLHSEQLFNREKDLKKSYLAVIHLDNNKLVYLQPEWFSGIELILNGDADKLVAWSNRPYAVEQMWLGGPEINDFYLVDVNTGKTEKIKTNCRATAEISPEGNYIYWYNAEDTSWNTYNIKTGKEFRVTNSQTVNCADEENDVPALASPYGIAGWLKNDEAMLVYDRFDIWKVDPENKYQPLNITGNGRKMQVRYMAIDFENINRKNNNDDKIGIDATKPLYIRTINIKTRANGFGKFNLSNNSFTELISGPFFMNRHLKAKDEDVFVYTRETFLEFPNLWISEANFKKPKQISDVNPQQKDFLWGTKELYTWTSLDGRKLEGLLIKPENFDPKKKYPMIVNFYETASQQLYNHHIPELHRSTVDYHYYSSNGYIIFNPDVIYKEGYPGEDAFNCVMPGVTQLISEGFVDEKSIAAQGHSWGGYQVAYLATRTNLFAAIETGAPVVNMFSAYGGIRLWTGQNRSFQYEHGQSRIGKSIWESPLRYIENSPLFTADKIQTPMLIMHNDDDGAVPFSQGVEFFIALRRLGKPSWMLNYNEADHWPTRLIDKYDFQIRMAQFFDHYLKGKPMPEWMGKGVPAVEKGLNMAY